MFDVINCLLQKNKMMSLILNNSPIMETLQDNPSLGVLSSVLVILINIIGTFSPLLTFSASVLGVILIILTIIAKCREIAKTNLDIKERKMDIEDHKNK